MAASIFYLFWIVISAGLFYYSFQFPSIGYGFTGPETFPRGIAVGLFILSAVLLIGNARQKEEYDTNLILNKRQMTMLIGFIAYVFTLGLLGYVISTIIFTVVSIFLLVSEKSTAQLVKAILTAACSVGIIYYVFSVKLKVFLPAAIWE